MKNVMKRAWEIKKEFDRKERNAKMNHNDFSPLKDSEKALFSECLKMAWEEAKDEATKEVSNVAIIKDWFMAKKFGKEVNNFSNKITIEKETAKAVYGTVGCSYDINSMAIWVPKSCLC